MLSISFACRIAFSIKFSSITELFSGEQDTPQTSQLAVHLSVNKIAIPVFVIA